MREGCETRAARVAHEARLTGVAGATPLARLERVRLFGARLELRAIVAMPIGGYNIIKGSRAIRRDLSLFIRQAAPDAKLLAAARDKPLPFDEAGVHPPSAALWG